MDIIAFEKKSGPMVAVNWYAKRRSDGASYIKKRIVVPAKLFRELSIAICEGAQPMPARQGGS